MPVRDAGKPQGCHLEQAYVYNVYDQIAPKFNEISQKAWPNVRRFLKDLKPGSFVADIGCGCGRYLHVNSKITKIGVDICCPLVECARTKGNEVLVADNLNLPFRDETFDAVISIGVIHHFSTKERRLDAIRELCRILVPGGQLMIYVWAFEQKHRRFDGQDVLIPWHGGTKGGKKGGGSIQSTCSDRDISSTTSSLSEDESTTDSQTSRNLLERTISDPNVMTGTLYPLDSYLSDYHHHQDNKLSKHHRSNTLPGSLEVLASDSRRDKLFGDKDAFVQEFVKFEASLLAMSSIDQPSINSVSYQQEMDDDVFCEGSDLLSKKTIRNSSHKGISLEDVDQLESTLVDYDHERKKNDKCKNQQNGQNYLSSNPSESTILSSSDSAPHFLTSLPYDAYKSILDRSVPHICDICPNNITSPVSVSQYLETDCQPVSNVTGVELNSDVYNQKDVSKSLQQKQESHACRKKSKPSLFDTLKESILNLLEGKSSSKKKKENMKQSVNGSSHVIHMVGSINGTKTENIDNFKNGSTVNVKIDDDMRDSLPRDPLSDSLPGDPLSDFAVREFPQSSCPTFRKELKFSGNHREVKSSNDLGLICDDLSATQTTETEFQTLDKKCTDSEFREPSNLNLNPLNIKSKVSSSNNGYSIKLGQGHRSTSLSNCTDITSGKNNSKHFISENKNLAYSVQSQNLLNSGHSNRTSRSLSSLPDTSHPYHNKELSVPLHHLPLKRRLKSSTVLQEKKRQTTKEVPLGRYLSCDNTTNNISRSLQELNQSNYIDLEKDTNILVPCRSVTTKESVSENPNLTMKNLKELSRFYHVFKDGELSEMISSVGMLQVVSCIYDHGNWCIIAEKITNGC